MRRVVRTDLAEQDLDEALSYLDERSPAAADRLATGIDDACQRLATQPGVGRMRDDLSPGLRTVVVEKYLIFFRVTDDEVIVVRILHAARDQGAIDWAGG